LALVAERERGVTRPASQAWADLHAKGYPSSSSIASQADVDSQATAPASHPSGAEVMSDKLPIEFFHAVLCYGSCCRATG
jgi:hypothetical protein